MPNLKGASHSDLPEAKRPRRPKLGPSSGDRDDADDAEKGPSAAFLAPRPGAVHMPELLFVIFDFLDAKTLLWRLPTMCRAWSATARCVLAALNLRDLDLPLCNNDDREHRFSGIASRCARITSFTNGRWA